MIVIENEVFICQWKKKNWSRFRVVLTKEMQGRNMHLHHRAIKIRQVQKSDRINSDCQSGSDQLGSNKKIKIK